jgi:hypothetical protein
MQTAAATQSKSPQAYTKTSASKLLGVSLTQVRRLIADGALQTSDIRIVGCADTVTPDSLYALLSKRGLPLPEEASA